MTHVVELEIRRFYRVYVEDENDSLIGSEITDKAKEEVLEHQDAVLTEDPDLEIEPQDILNASYEYSF